MILADTDREWTGTALRQLRSDRGWTQADLAQVLGIALGTLWAWESDRRPVNRTAARLLDLIDEDRIIPRC